MPNRKLLACLVLAAAVLPVGCGSDPQGGADAQRNGSSTVTAVGGGVGGVAKCNAEQIGKAVAAVGNSQGTTAALEGSSFWCADGWAVAQALVGKDPDQIDETMVFEAEGQFWIPKDRAEVCPRPSDVPKSLYDRACNTN